MADATVSALGALGFAATATAALFPGVMRFIPSADSGMAHTAATFFEEFAIIWDNC